MTRSWRIREFFYYMSEFQRIVLSFDINQCSLHETFNSSMKLCTAQKMKFSIKDFFIQFDQIRRKLPIWSNWLEKSLMENFIFVQCWMPIWNARRILKLYRVWQKFPNKMWGIELIGKQNVEVMIRKIVKPVLQSSRKTSIA